MLQDLIKVSLKFNGSFRGIAFYTRFRSDHISVECETSRRPFLLDTTTPIGYFVALCGQWKVLLKYTVAIVSVIFQRNNANVL